MFCVGWRSLVSTLRDRLRASFSELCGIDLWVLVNGRWNVCGLGRLCFIVFDFLFFGGFGYEFA